MSTRADSPGWLKDGNLAFHGGCDGSVPPSNIDRNQLASAVNATMRGGYLSPRPGWQRRALTFASEAIETAFTASRFQHGAFYADTISPALLSAHGGRLFHLNLRDYSVQEITPLKSDGSIDRNSSTQEIGWSVQAEEYWVYQDNQSYPIIFNGSGCRRANPAIGEVPIGNVMAYAQARLAVALPNRHSYLIGDLLFGPSGTEALGRRDAVLKFTENNYLNEGGDYVARVFGAPSTDGKITAMQSVAMTDTSLGQGPLLIGTPYSVFTVQLPFDRTIWKDLPNPLRTNAPLLGPLSQDSMVLVNGDIWYRSLDGIRSYVMAQRQFGTSWGNTPMSAEISEHLSYDTESLLEHGSAVLFDNRLLMTTSPSPSDWGVFHRSLAVLDFHLVSTMSKTAAPVWEGSWTGVRILKMVKGMVGNEERCFAWVLSDSYEIELWELVKDAKFDNGDTAIDWSFELPSYNCGNSDQFKRLETGRMVLNKMAGTVSGTVTYRTDQNPCYTAWDSFTFCAKNEDCCVDLTTTTSAQFTIPVSGNTVQVTVASTVGMTTDQTAVTIGAYSLVLVSVDSSTLVTVRNTTVSQNNAVVASGVTVAFCGYECAGPHTYREQQRTVRLKMPPDTFDIITGLKLRTGYEHQPQVAMSGFCQVRQFRMYELDQPEQLGITNRDPL